MNHWLMKSEPGAWSWDDQVAAGKQGAEWDGIRNHQAANNMKAMRKGDRCFFYHSVDEKRIVGIVRVVREYYPDPSDATGRFGMVDVASLKAFKTPVSLAEVKAEPRLAELALVKHTRLSVMPIPEEAWKLLCEMGGVRP